MPPARADRGNAEPIEATVRSWVLARIAMAVPTAIGVAALSFLLLHFIPGDPIDAMLGETASTADRELLRQDLGLDQPLATEFASFLWKAAHGDLGTSLRWNRPVTDLILERAPATALLAGTAVAVSLVLALVLGCAAALRPFGLIDRLTLAAALAAVAIPNFWLGPMLILLFSIHLGWLPLSGYGSAAHLILPAFTLGASMSGLLARIVRSTVLETLREDYVRTAKAKGLAPTAVLIRHALAGALTPIITIVGLESGALLGGAVVTETIFSWPGIGRLVIEAINARDYPLVRGAVAVIALTYVAINLIADLLYGAADPRIRHGRQD